MLITHNLRDINSARKTDEPLGFMLSNKKGGYFASFGKPLSKYHGLFLFDPSAMSMHRTIESIEIEDAGEITELRNNIYFFERQREGLTEGFVMPSGRNCLLYELSEPSRINVFLDFKESYDNRQWGRNYHIAIENGVLLVSFVKTTDEKEDQTHGQEEYRLYLAAKSDYEGYGVIDEWIERDYDFDRQRNSQSKRFAYKAVSMHGSRFVFSMSKDKNEAIIECKKSFADFEKLKKDEEHYTERMLHNFGVSEVLSRKDIGNEIKLAYVNAANSLNNLLVHDEFKPGLLAGFPWFFQYWSRDSMVCLTQITRLSHSMGAKMLHDYLGAINSEGRINNLLGQYDSSPNFSSDANGWLFARCHRIVHAAREHRDITNAVNKIVLSVGKSKLDDITAKKIMHARDVSEREFYNSHRLETEIEMSLGKSLSRLEKSKTSGLLEHNLAKETWMDTKYENDAREGFRIEIQALRLNMYRLMHELTWDSKYKSLENLMHSKVISVFWNKKILADGMGDFTARPNVFIAAYVYRHLLSKEEWETCFDEIIPKLWLSWGGFSTIDKSNPLFTGSSTGEDVKSYHRGDSWFWINSLAAIVLHKTNREKYKEQVSKILSAGCEEILWKGSVGCASEISDAKELSSRGCFNQAWSNAMFLEMVDEIFGN